MATGDEIHGEAGDDSKIVGIGKGIEQRTSSNTVHNYIATEREKRIEQVDSYDRLERIEETLDLVADFVIGNEKRRRAGLVDQFDAYVKSDREWKKAIEKRMDEVEGARTHIFITPQVAVLLIIIGGLSLVVAFFVISWLAGSGARTPIAIPFLQMLSAIIANFQGRIGWTS